MTGQEGFESLQNSKTGCCQKHPLPLYRTKSQIEHENEENNKQVTKWVVDLEEALFLVCFWTEVKSFLL